MKGSYKLFPKRFNSAGVALEVCNDVRGKLSYGADCDKVKKAFLAAIVPAGTAFVDRATALKTPICHESNEAAYSKYTDDKKCSLRAMANGVFQWVDTATVSCIANATLKKHTGTADCTWFSNYATIPMSGSWKKTDEYVTVDGPAFRTLGKTDKSVPDASV